MPYDVTFLLEDGKPSPLRFCAPTEENTAAHLALHCANTHRRDFVVVESKTDRVVQMIRYRPLTTGETAARIIGERVIQIPAGLAPDAVADWCKTQMQPHERIAGFVEVPT